MKLITKQQGFIMKCTNCDKEIKRVVHKNTKRPFCDMKCYAGFQRGSSFSEQGKPERAKRACGVDGCDKIHFGRGLCRSHYVKATAKETKARIEMAADAGICEHCGSVFPVKHKGARYCSSKCSGLARRKEFIVKNGYKKVLMPEHHRSDRYGYVLEHILIAEASIGRDIIHPEEVHHVDFNKMNNSPDNLIVCANHKEHMMHHRDPKCSKE